MPVGRSRVRRAMRDRTSHTLSFLVRLANGDEKVSPLPTQIGAADRREKAPAFVAPCPRRISRSLFVFCFEKDPPHGLYSLPFQKAKVLQALYVLVAVVWLVPDRRIERVLAGKET
jgi:hypothetical protein